MIFSLTQNPIGNFLVVHAINPWRKIKRGSNLITVIYDITRNAAPLEMTRITSLLTHLVLGYVYLVDYRVFLIHYLKHLWICITHFHRWNNCNKSHQKHLPIYLKNAVNLVQTQQKQDRRIKSLVWFWIVMAWKELIILQHFKLFWIYMIPTLSLEQNLSCVLIFQVILFFHTIIQYLEKTGTDLACALSLPIRRISIIKPTFLDWENSCRSHHLHFLHPSLKKGQLKKIGICLKLHWQLEWSNLSHIKHLDWNTNFLG